MKRILLPLLLLTTTAAFAADRPKPLRILLVTGGCCHDYVVQKEILKEGLEARLNAVVEQAHTPDKTTKPPLPILGNEDYAKGYDLVIHDECAADIKDPAVVEKVLKPHRDGLPGVNLHCAMHCYRVGNVGQPLTAGTPGAMWVEYLGVQSSGHGPRLPIDIAFAKEGHPIVKNLGDWRTVNEELYNNIQIFPSAIPLARGHQSVPQKDGTVKEMDFVVAWGNNYGKTRVFSTTIGHVNETVEDDRYLDLVANGTLWALGKLDDNGKPTAGYEASAEQKAHSAQLKAERKATEKKAADEAAAAAAAKKKADEAAKKAPAPAAVPAK